MRDIRRGAVSIRRPERGSAIVETALLAPWIFFLFIGVFDVGFYNYAVIATQSAARAAAMATSGDSTLGSAQYQILACAAAKDELARMPNNTFASTCNAAPLTVSQVTSAKAACPDYDVSYPAAGEACTQVTVSYQTVPLIPIPGVLPGRLTITRVVRMRFNAP
ncbi:MAG: TadE family protein [Bryobacteraceae bacterium]